MRTPVPCPNPPHGFVFDPRVSDDWQGLLFRCVTSRDEVAAVAALRAGLPANAHVRRSAEGIRIPSGDAVRLLDPGSSVSVRWTETTRRFLQNRRRVAGAYPLVRAELAEIGRRGVDYARGRVSDSDGLDVLDPHQVVNVAAMTLPEGFGLCLFDEQGAGKTVTLIFAFDLLVARDEADLLLVVSPKSMVPEWPKDFARFRPGLYRVTSVTGSAPRKRALLRDGSDVYVTNFETVVALEAQIDSLLRVRPGRAVLVVDESFFVKSPDAKRTRALRRLREWCGRAFVLCGTPAPNAPQDLVEQFSLVDLGLAFEGVSLPRGREQALPVAQRTVRERGLYLRHLKSEVLPELPPKSFHRLYVPLQPRQRALYERLRDGLVEDLSSVTDVQFRRTYATFLARRTALLQVCSSPASVADDHTETPAKLLLLDDLLDRLVRQGREKVVLWSFYTASVDALVERYADLGVLRYDGRVTDTAERGDAVRLFQEDGDCRLLVANPAAAGAGLTLHSARFAVYESFSNQAAHYLQSLDRVHRRGQTRDVEYVVLLCEDTVEVAEYDRLLRKQRMAGDLLGDVPDASFTRESLLRELSTASK